MGDDAQLEAEVTSGRAVGADQMVARHVGRVAAVFDRIPTGVAVWSCAGRLLHANPVMSDLVRTDPATLTGASIDMFIREDRAADVRRMLSELCEGSRNSFECEMRCHGPDGAAMWLTAHVTGVFGSGGHAEYLVSQIFDFHPSGDPVADSRSGSAPVGDMSGSDLIGSLVYLSHMGEELELVHDVLDSLPVAVARLDVNGHVLYANACWSDVIGDPAAPGARSSWFEMLAAETAEEIVALSLGSLDTGESFTIRVRVRPPDASETVWWALTVVPSSPGHGAQTGGGAGELTVIVDTATPDPVVSSRVTQLAEVLDASSDYLMIVERSLVVSYSNDAARLDLGLEARGPRGKGGARLDELMTPDTVEFFHDVIEPALVFDSRWRGELELRGRDGAYVPVSALFLAHGATQGRFDSVAIVARDITDLKAAQSKLRALATHDYLTGLPNRILLHDRIEHALARFARHGQPVALMYVDLDGFKPVNDRHGHRFGDAVLIEVADRIHAAIRETDTAARIGGDEFAVVVEGIGDLAVLTALAERLIEAVSVPVEHEGRSMSVGASAGLVLADEGCTDPDALIGRADAAMYRAKAEGRGRCVVITEDDRLTS